MELSKVQPSEKTCPRKEKGEEQGFWSRVLHSAGQDLSISGLRYATGQNEPLFRRLMWCLLIFSGFGFMFYQVSSSFLKFYERPELVNIKKTFPSAMDFPSVTFCNENKYVRSKVRQLGLEAAFEKAFPIDITERFFGVNYTEFGEAVKPISQKLFPSYVAFLRQISYTAKDIIYDCTFAGHKCDEDWFEEVWTDMGLCYQFNPAAKGLYVTSVGATYGLNLFLTVGQAEYLAVPSFSAGFRVSVSHSAQGRHPVMGYKSFRISPGVSTEVALSEKQTILQEPPYGTCTKKNKLRRFSIYSREHCTLECKANTGVKLCGCVFRFFPALPGENLCDISEAALCLANMFKKTSSVNGSTYIDHSADCICDIECNAIAYDMDVSSNIFSNFAVSFVSNTSGSISVNGTTPPVQSEKWIRDNVVAVDMYFQELSTTTYQSAVAYSSVMLLNDIGGALGLMLGSTFFTLYEFFDILIWAGILRRKVA